MKTRFLFAAAFALVAATGALALSSQHNDWFSGPVQFLMSKEEIAKWKSLKTDDEAKAFIDLFWARRDPTPATPGNEARGEFDARVTWADANLKQGKTRGAMTDRGRMLILYGQPKRVERSGPAAPNLSSMNDLQDTSNSVQWVYEGDDAKAIFGTTRAAIRFVDQSGGQEFRLERGAVDLNAAQQRAITRMIVSPNLTTAPSFTAAAPAAPVAATPAPVAATTMTALATPALATAVTEFKAAAKNPYDGKAYATWGEYVTPTGEYYVPVMLYVPKSSGITADGDVTFFGVVEDESGKSVLAFEQRARLATAKDDFFIDKSLSLPAGKHRGIFGIARNGTPIAITSTDMTLAGSLDKDAAAVSQLLLSNYVAAAQEMTEPTEPFSFGGVKVVPKADKAFRTTDELWFFFALRNPGLAEAEAKPKIQVKMDVEGKGPDGKPIKKSAPPREIDAVPMKGVPGHYGVGSAIPLESFKPGDYTITLKVMDTVKKTSYTLSESFKVVQ